MLGYFLVLGALVLIIHLIFGELSLRTPDYKRLPGFVEFYFGKNVKKISLISVIFGSFGSLLAYLIVGGEFFSSALIPIFGGNNLVYTLIYFIIGTLLIYFGITAVSKIEFWALISFFVILIAIFFKGFSSLKLANIFPAPDLTQLFLPYGAILFSLWGMNLIPEIEEMLGDKKKMLKKVIFTSILIPMIVYLFFIYLILGITGPQTTESALTGLKNFLGDGIVTLGLLFGVITTFTSFIAIGLTLKKVFWYDLKMPKNLAFIITCFLPLILFFMGIKSFIPLISFIGGIMLGIDGILIILMYQKIKGRKFILLTCPLALIFVFGVIYEIIYFTS